MIIFVSLCFSLFMVYFSCLSIQKFLKFVVPTFVIICFAFCQCHHKVAHYFGLTRTQITSFRKEKQLCYHIPDKSTGKKFTLLRSIGVYAYISKRTFIAQLPYLIGVKLESAGSCFINGLCTVQPPCFKQVNNLAEC